jgi:hypothetical protein
MIKSGRRPTEERSLLNLPPNVSDHENGDPIRFIQCRGLQEWLPLLLLHRANILPTLAVGADRCGCAHCCTKESYLLFASPFVPSSSTGARAPSPSPPAPSPAVRLRILRVFRCRALEILVDTGFYSFGHVSYCLSIQRTCRSIFPFSSPRSVS